MFCSLARHLTLTLPLSTQGPVVQKMHSAIHWRNHYPVDSVVCFGNTYPLDRIYPVDSGIHPLNNRAQEYKWVPANCQGNLTKCWGVTCDGLE